MNSRKLLAIIAIIGTLAALHACKHESDDSPTDLELLNRSRGPEAAVWYKFSNALLPRSSGSGHFESLLRTRFNSVAAAQLDTLGKVEEGTVFPEGSLIVKELWPNASGLGTYAVMLKRSGDAAADENGWVWGYIRDNGEVRQTAVNRGAACKGCHAGPGNINGTLMNAAYP
ncbi:MAG: cytochrome P460 family protein [Flavobacteriales bacterium]|nr:cytochrome P460 family protein [Flavobacteriales bacterium]